MIPMKKLEYLFMGLMLFLYVLVPVGYVFLGNFNTILISMMGIISAIILLKLIKTPLKKLLIICSSLIWFPVLNLVQCRIREICSFMEGILLYQFLKATIIVMIIVTIIKVVTYLRNKNR